LIRFFRINDPYRLLVAFGLLLIARIIWWSIGTDTELPQMRWLLTGERLGDGFVMYRDFYDYTGPLSALVYRLIDLIVGRSALAHELIAFFILCINASLLSVQLVRSKAYSENNYLPGFFYVLMAIAIPDGASLSPALMSSTFILLALNNVIRRIDNEASDELFLYAGIFLGLSVLFYLPAITFFFILLLSLIVFSTAIPRRILLYVYGLTIPFILAMANYYWNDAIDYFFEQYVIGGLTLNRRFYLSMGDYWRSGSVMIFWTGIALFLVIVKGRFGNYETKIIQIMLLLAVAAGFSVWLDVSLQPSQFYLFAPSAAFFLTHLVLLMKHRIWKRVIPSLLIISLLINVPFTRYVVDFRSFDLVEQKLPLEQRKTMVLSEIPEPYFVNQKISGPFLNASLSTNQLRYLNYYETSYQIFEAIENEKPEIIVDDLILMPLIFKRFPLLAEDYRTGASNIYYLK
jgi:hypothetical protein